MKHNKHNTIINNNIKIDLDKLLDNSEIELPENGIKIETVPVEQEKMKANELLQLLNPGSKNYEKLKKLKDYDRSVIKMTMAKDLLGGPRTTKNSESKEVILPNISLIDKNYNHVLASERSSNKHPLLTLPKITPIVKTKAPDESGSIFLTEHKIGKRNKVEAINDDITQ
jgi:hypothetical protein